MQTTRDFIAASPKFSTRMQRCHDHFQSRLFLLWVDIYRDAASIISHPYTAVRQDSYLDQVTGTGQCFVNRIVNDFVNQVMERFYIRSTDIHTRSPANSLQAL